MPSRMSNSTAVRPDATLRPDVESGPGDELRGPANSNVRVTKPHAGWSSAFGIVIFVLILFPLIALASSTVYVWRTASTIDATRTDAIVVLGAAQYNGTPSPVFKARLAHAAELFNQGIAPRIVTVGGKQSGDQFTEATAGKRWLEAQGIAPDRIAAIDAGHNTIDSIKAVAVTAEESGWKSITLDSDPAHVARSAAIASRVGLVPHVNPTQVGDGSAITAGYVTKETLGYVAFEVLDQWAVPRLVS